MVVDGNVVAGTLFVVFKVNVIGALDAFPIPVKPNGWLDEDVKPEVACPKFPPNPVDKPPEFVPNADIPVDGCPNVVEDVVDGLPNVEPNENPVVEAELATGLGLFDPKLTEVFPNMIFLFYKVCKCNK